MTDDRRDLVDKYFAHVPDRRDNTTAWTYLIGGIAAALIGVALLTGKHWLTGVAVLAIGVAVAGYGALLRDRYRSAYLASTPKPRDSIVDTIRDHELRKVETRALERLDLTAEDLELESATWDPLATPQVSQAEHRLARRPLIVIGPVPTSEAMIGRDGVWRFSQYAVLAICPTGYHLALYRCVIDLRVTGLFQEETHEYHYMDVVAVSTAINAGSPIIAQSAESDTGNYRFQQALLHEFQLVVSSSDRSKIVVGISDKRNPDHQARLPTTGIDDVIAAVRTMLRDKKAGQTT